MAEQLQPGSRPLAAGQKVNAATVAVGMFATAAEVAWFVAWLQLSMTLFLWADTVWCVRRQLAAEGMQHARTIGG